MAFHECAIQSPARPEAVWQVWSQPESWPDWNPDVESISLDRSLSAGSRGTMTTKRGGPHQVMIESVVPGESFWLVSTGLPGHKLAFRCQVLAADGGSRISQGVEVRGPLGGLFSAMMGKQIAQSLRPVLEALSEKAESD